MGSKQIAIVIAVVMIVGGIPAVGAEHLSVGYEDAWGVSPEEAPNDEDRTVNASAHERGITTECFEANTSSADTGEIVNASEADPFCGDLVYHNDSSLRQESPQDQDFAVNTISGALDIGTFDVRTTRSYMLAHEARLIRNDLGVNCQPFCEDNPAGTGQALWEAFHSTGETLGLTDGPEEASNQSRDDRTQLYGADVHTLTARYVLQQADLHEMNGWYIPGPTRSFVAFLHDDDGNPIGEKRLAESLGPLKDDGTIPTDAVPSICGWTPDADFVSTGGTSACEVKFEYEGAHSSDADFKEGYEDKCKSPTYVCSAVSGGAWYANFDCICTNFPVDLGEENIRDYIRWHWVVAPTLPECGSQEPGFLTETGTDIPYLAHDVDVYTNPFALQGVEDARSAPTVTGTTSSMAVEQSQNVLEELPGFEDTGGVPLPSSVAKADRVEPNAQPVGALADTSQSMPEEHPNGADLFRELGDPCEQLTGSEDEDTIDPWVDLIDGEVVPEITGASISAFGTGASAPASPGLYGNEDAQQDDDNHPGPDLYRTNGNVGLFTDKNDDGTYDAIAGDTLLFSESKTDGDTIEETGAYPMIWDVRIHETNEGFELDEGAGCQIAGDGLTTGAKEAGFGPETALFQAVYLREPTVFVDQSTGDTIPYLEGDNVYLFLSQSAKAFREQGVDNHVTAEIDRVVSELSKLGSDPDVVVPGNTFGFTSDFGDQCPEPTGGFTLDMSFAHSCQLDCSDDTIVTGYTFELTKATLGGGSYVPVFSVNSQAFDFGAGTYAWTDVDPFDNDPDRQDDADASPPTE